MIPKRDIDPDLLASVKNIKAGTSLDDIICAVIVAFLERNNGNRTHTSYDLGMALRTFRYNLKFIEAKGYEVPKYRRKLRSEIISLDEDIPCP